MGSWVLGWLFRIFDVLGVVSILVKPYQHRVGQNYGRLNSHQKNKETIRNETKKNLTKFGKKDRGRKDNETAVGFFFRLDAQREAQATSSGALEGNRSINSLTQSRLRNSSCMLQCLSVFPKSPLPRSTACPPTRARAFFLPSGSGTLPRPAPFLLSFFFFLLGCVF